MLKYIKETENLSLVFDEGLLNQGEKSAWRLELNDSHGHYESEVFLRKEHLCDLLSALKSIEKEICKEDFI
jgi:hypothetical protein